MTTPRATKSTGSNRTFGAQRKMDKRMEVVRLKLIEAGSILRKIWEPSLCFTGLLLFYPFLKMHDELHDFFFPWKFKKSRRKLS